MPEITIVDTSSLFYFHRVGLFELFNKLYGHITVPEAVKNEVKIRVQRARLWFTPEG
jgi:predicted nucleic acid-binding protein